MPTLKLKYLYYTKSAEVTIIILKNINLLIKNFKFHASTIKYYIINYNSNP